jgi:hypothetical protein
MVRPTVCAILLALAPAFARGQQPVVNQPLDSATVVRLRLSDGTRFTAQLLAPFGPESTSVVYAPPRYRDCGVPRAQCRLQISAAQLSAIEVQQGSDGWRGALVGGGVGAMLGLILGAMYDGSMCDTGVPGGCSGPSKGAVMGLTTFLGAALGSGVGALFGMGSPRWGPAP